MTVVSAATLFHRPEHAHVDLSDLAETADFLDRTYGCACASELGGGEGGRRCVEMAAGDDRGVGVGNRLLTMRRWER
jgi:hypothetical protein